MLPGMNPNPAMNPTSPTVPAANNQVTFPVTMVIPNLPPLQWGGQQNGLAPATNTTTNTTTPSTTNSSKGIGVAVFAMIALFLLVLIGVGAAWLVSGYRDEVAALKIEKQITEVKTEFDREVARIDGNVDKVGLRLDSTAKDLRGEIATTAKDLRGEIASKADKSTVDMLDRRVTDIEGAQKRHAARLERLSQQGEQQAADFSRAIQNAGGEIIRRMNAQDERIGNLEKPEWTIERRTTTRKASR
jgi:hypothetical protein